MLCCVALHSHSHGFRDVAGRLHGSGRMGNCISPGRKAWSKEELATPVSVDVRGVDGPQAH